LLERREIKEMEQLIPLLVATRDILMTRIRETDDDDDGLAGNALHIGDAIMDLVDLGMNLLFQVLGVDTDDDDDDPMDGDRHRLGGIDDLLRTFSADYIDLAYRFELPPPLCSFPRSTFAAFTDEELRVLTHFTRNELQQLMVALRIPDVVALENRSKVNGELYLLAPLHRFTQAGGNLDSDSLFTFGRDQSQLSRLFNHFISYMMDTFARLLYDNLQSFLTVDNLNLWDEKMKEKALSQYNHVLTGRYVGFVDGHDTRWCNPGHGPMTDGQRRSRELQMAFYNAYKHFAGGKFDTFVTLSGLTIASSKTYSRRRNDNHPLNAEQWNARIEARELAIGVPANDLYQFYGDRGFGIGQSCLAGPHIGLITPLQQRENRVMSGLRIAIEWTYGEVINQFPFVRYLKNFKLLLHPNVKHYCTVAMLLRNAQVCMRGNNTGEYFDCLPPAVNDYFQVPAGPPVAP
jgi:nuclease HARBI1